MGRIREAAAQPLAVDLRSRDGFDPSLLHWWSEVRPRGEWTTVDVSPACTPSIRRQVPVDLIDDREALPDPSLFPVCPVCAEVTRAYYSRQCQRGVHHSATVEHDCVGVA